MSLLCLKTAGQQVSRSCKHWTAASLLMPTSRAQHRLSRCKHTSTTLDPEYVKTEEFMKLNRIYREQTHYAVRPKDCPAKETSILLFPGQGSQYVGMGKELADSPAARKVYDTASAILGYNVMDMCLNGSGGNLNKTTYSQHAILVTSLAAMEVLREQNPEAISKCVSTAGYDVGELAALVLAGSLSLIDAVTIVQKRAEFMQKCSEAVPSGMLGVILNHKSKLNYALHMSRLYCQKSEQFDMVRPVCSIAVDMYTHCKMIAGHDHCLDFIEREAEAFGIEHTVRIPVSGAFHSSLMYNAGRRLLKVLELIDIREPEIPVYSNLTCRPFSSAKETKEYIALQLSERVKWEQMMHTLTPRPKEETDFPQIYAVGPSQQLGNMLKNTNQKAFSQGFKSMPC